MTRRSVLQRCVVLAVALSFAATWRGPTRNRVHSELEACLCWIGPLQRARLGRLYLRLHPEERASVQELRRRMERGGALASLRREIVEDFAQRRTVRADRWVLARSEARLLAALADAAGPAC